MEMHTYEKEHLEALRPWLADCTVLLRTNGAFPLNGPCKLALYGAGARHTIKGGTGSGDVNVRFYATVEQALKNAGFQITTAKWLAAYDAELIKAQAQNIIDIKARAKEKHKLAALEAFGSVMPEPEYDLPLDGAGDVAVYVLTRISGEGGDRNLEKGDYLLTDTETRDILALQKQYKKFLLVLNVGGPVDLSPLEEVDNILLLSQIGTETGDALADILLGKTTPSGKLTTSWMRSEDLQNIGTFGDRDDTEYREGIYVGYRYYNTVGTKPLFPFGHGLSYTTFHVDTPAVALDGTTVEVTATVHNTGDFAGKEVLEVYLSKPQGELDQPFQELAAFAKTPLLAAGSSATVTATFDLADISSFHAGRSAYVLEQGDHVVRAGTCSAHTFPAAVLRLDETVETRTVRTLLGDPGFEDWTPADRRTEDLPEDLPVLPVSAAAFSTETAAYGKTIDVPQTLKNLPDEDIIHMNIGNYGKLGGLAIIIGNASQNVCGAAGDSTGLVKGMDLKQLVMADGPAGLRLAKQFFRDKKGLHKVGDDSIGDMIGPFLPGFVTKLMSLTNAKPKANAVIEDQYTTAIPIGTALAQSFSPEFAELCGDIVGDEMSRFGVHLWLAPALNIHRSVLCGRNFEYYSEDPLVSGLIAAAITRGVQRHKGCGVTLKHFCANNQEENRYNNNSKVSERAMREIYLRGFERAVRDASPKAIMSSYNLLNGTHTAESEALNRNILRDEWGFDGLIMTDWIVSPRLMGAKGSRYPAPTGDGMAKAGTDLIMPGSDREFKQIEEALKRGTIRRDVLEENAAYVYNMITELID